MTKTHTVLRRCAVLSVHLLFACSNISFSSGETNLVCNDNCTKAETTFEGRQSEYQGELRITLVAVLYANRDKHKNDIAMMFRCVSCVCSICCPCMSHM